MIETNSVFLCPSKDLFIETSKYIAKCLNINYIDNFLNGSLWDHYQQNTYIAIRSHRNIVFGDTTCSYFHEDIINGNNIIYTIHNLFNEDFTL